MKKVILTVVLVFVAMMMSCLSTPEAPVWEPDMSDPLMAAIHISGSIRPGETPEQYRDRVHRETGLTDGPFGITGELRDEISRRNALFNELRANILDTQ